MNVFEELMNQRWIAKGKEREKYYRIKDGIGEIKEFIREKLGYRLIDNGMLVKLEKLPGEALPWMGIDEFSSKMEYAFFCLILMFLEDKEVEEQFVLSQLTEYIAAQYPEDTIEWTVYENRRKLIRVMKYAMKQGLFFNNDGSEDGFAVELETEALYENTGLSKYFTRNFTKDISEYTKVEDFFQSEWMDMDEDRGVVRKQRVYRKLLLTPGIYKDKEKDEDLAYIKNYRSSIEHDFERMVDCSLQVHKTSAYIILGENGTLGKVFPGNNSISDAILLIFFLIQKKVSKGELAVGVDETIVLSEQEMKELIMECKRTFGVGFAKKYREDMSETEFANTILEEMEQFDMIRIDLVTKDVTIMPVAGKISGMYPEAYLEKENINVIE
ncbi:MAG: TIGR02678 family protein [Clostridiales bacterium]|nr:TIGR02678 family protein [Clostridiales bacterium]